MSERAVLAGGPRHGQRITVQPSGDYLAMPTAGPPPLVAAQPKRPSWLHPVRRLRYTPPPPPEPPKLTTLIYRPDGQLGDGTRIYWYRGTSEPPPPGTKAAWQQLVDAYEATSPRDRWNHRIHWEMGLDWYKAIRRTTDPDGDEDEWEPQEGDMVLGIPIIVHGPVGTPRLTAEDDLAG